MATKLASEIHAMLLELREHAVALDNLIHQNFPLGGHATVEKAQEHLGAMLRRLKDIKPLED